MVRIPKEFKKMGYYFGGCEDGYYLKFHKEVIQTWTWMKPSQEVVEGTIRQHIIHQERS